MHYIGIDLHKKESQICALDEQDEVLLEVRIPTSRADFTDALGSYRGARILLEASTESEWVAGHLESLGFEVIVADPNFAPMYATRSKKIKTDRRDARCLAQACRLGAYRKAHRLAQDKRQLRGQLHVRDALVRTRARYVSLCRTLLRGQGYRVADGAIESFPQRLDKLQLPQQLQEQLGPLLALLGPLNEQIAGMDQQLETQAKQSETATKLCSMPSIGPVTALAFISVIDEARRFTDAHQVQSYLGLVPREYSSGEKQNRGHITKSGSPRIRSLLLQAALSTMRLKKESTQPLWQWAEGIEKRRGKKIATVALARRIAGVMWAMMRDGTSYRGPKKEPAAQAA